VHLSVYTRSTDSILCGNIDGICKDISKIAGHASALESYMWLCFLSFDPSIGSQGIVGQVYPLPESLARRQK
jgi:hypothetical protein